jgi:hypothetical protein
MYGFLGHAEHSSNNSHPDPFFYCKWGFLPKACSGLALKKIMDGFGQPATWQTDPNGH